MEPFSRVASSADAVWPRRESGSEGDRAPPREPGGFGAPPVDLEPAPVEATSWLRGYLVASSCSARVPRARPSGPVAPSTRASPTLRPDAARVEPERRFVRELGAWAVAEQLHHRAELHEPLGLARVDGQQAQLLGLLGRGRGSRSRPATCGRAPSPAAAAPPRRCRACATLPTAAGCAASRAPSPTGESRAPATSSAPPASTIQTPSTMARRRRGGRAGAVRGASGTSEGDVTRRRAQRRARGSLPPGDVRRRPISRPPLMDAPVVCRNSLRVRLVLPGAHPPARSRSAARARRRAGRQRPAPEGALAADRARQRRPGPDPGLRDPAARRHRPLRRRAADRQRVQAGGVRRLRRDRPLPHARGARALPRQHLPPARLDQHRAARRALQGALGRGPGAAAGGRAPRRRGARRSSW